MKTREEVLQDVVQLLGKVSEDWEYGGEITPDTRFFADMGLTSLDVVMLGTAIQEHYGRVFPFMKLFAEMGERQIPDIPVGVWVDFIHRQMEGEVVEWVSPPGNIGNTGNSGNSENNENNKR